VHALLLIVLIAQSAAEPADVALERIHARVAVVPVSGNTASLAGKYTSTPEELTSRWGGGSLSGDELHLFPDGTYVYCEWADVEPMTIYDKGAWHVSGKTVTLSSDPEIKWDPNAGREFLLLRRETRTREVLLVGLKDGIDYFEKEADAEPEFMLLLVGLLRVHKYDQRDARQTKAELMKRAWRPEYFARKK
jgi:hypothetical protein